MERNHVAEIPDISEIISNDNSSRKTLPDGDDPTMFDIRKREPLTREKLMEILGNQSKVNVNLMKACRKNITVL